MFLAMYLLLQDTPVQNTPVAGAASVVSAPAAPGGVRRLTAGSALVVELVAPLSSATSHLGDRFAFRVVEPIKIDGAQVVGAGAMGEGEVIDAAHAGMAGAAGKLVLSARRIDLDGRSAPVRGLTLMAAGQRRVGLVSGALLVPYVGVSALLIRGGEVEVPAGTRYSVKLAQDVDFPSNPPKASEGKTK